MEKLTKQMVFKTLLPFQEKLCMLMDPQQMPNSVYQYSIYITLHTKLEQQWLCEKIRKITQNTQPLNKLGRNYSPYLGKCWQLDSSSLFISPNRTIYINENSIYTQDFSVKSDLSCRRYLILRTNSSDKSQYFRKVL